MNCKHKNRVTNIINPNGIFEDGDDGIEETYGQPRVIESICIDCGFRKEVVVKETEEEVEIKPD